MEATFVLREQEFTQDIIDAIRGLFRVAPQLEIRVAPTEGAYLLQKETPEEYHARLRQAIEDIERKHGLTVVDTSRLDEFAENLAS